MIFAYKLYRYYLLSKAGMYEIDKMSGEEFEKYMGILFTKLGYSVRHVGNQRGDYGVDLVLEKDGIKTAVQAKRYNSAVGISAVREAYGGKNIYNCTEAMVVTNRFYTNMAKDLARTNRVTLWNRNDLAKQILSTK